MNARWTGLKLKHGERLAKAYQTFEHFATLEPEPGFSGVHSNPSVLASLRSNGGRGRFVGALYKRISG